LRERNGQQEREENLNSWKCDAQLIEELDQLAVEPLVLALLRHAAEVTQD
jgi:hypothetical protein